MLTIDGIAVKNPKGFEVELEEKYGTEETNALGNIIVDRIATKRILKIDWGFMTQAEMANVMTSMDDVFFTVAYPDPRLGATTKTFKVDRKSAPKSIVGSGGVVFWDGLSVTLKER